MIELLEKYPKAAKTVREYFLERLIESLNNKELPEEFKEHVRQQGITNEKVAKLIDNQARALFDVFDENKIFISLVVDGHKTDLVFRFSFDGHTESNDFDTRKEAEKAAVEKAFELLEEKL